MQLNSKFKISNSKSHLSASLKVTLTFQFHSRSLRADREVSGVERVKFQTNYNIQNPKSQTAKISVLDLKHCNLEFVWCLVLGAWNFRRRRSGFTPHLLWGLKENTDSAPKKGAGFTLIELIIYLGILSIILVSMSYLMLDILGGQTKIYGNQDVNQNLRFISNYLIKDIRAASDISSLSADTLVLFMPGDDITYNFVAAEKKLTRHLGSNDPIQLNSDRVEITGNFSDLSYHNKVKEVGVYLVIIYKNPDNLPDYNASTTSAFSVGLRGRR